MKVGIPYGSHGEELLPLALGESLIQEPIKNVYPFLQNPDAAALGVRFVEENFCMAICQSDPNSPILERRLAAKALKWCTIEDCDIFLDWHSTKYPSEAAYMSLLTDRRARRIGNYFGLDNTIFSEHGLPGVLSKAVCIDITETGPPTEREIRKWRQTIGELANDFDNLDDFGTSYIPSVKTRYWQYGDAIPIPQPARTDYRAYDASEYAGNAFRRFTQRDLFDLNLEHPGIYSGNIYGINIGIEHLYRGWLGEFVFPITDVIEPRFREKYAHNARIAHELVRRGVEQDNNLLLGAVN